jgi:hypothetical protein
VYTPRDCLRVNSTTYGTHKLFFVHVFKVRKFLGLGTFLVAPGPDFCPNTGTPLLWRRLVVVTIIITATRK